MSKGIRPGEDYERNKTTIREEFAEEQGNRGDRDRGRRKKGRFSRFVIHHF
jgi:hypothetical protein